jgi:biofilm PGA synthesis N-glycosyltransferase PgaC
VTYFLLCSFILTVIYIIIMMAYKNEWNEIEEVHTLANNCSTTVSIIIPARNEAKNIANLLQDITNQIYPKELIEVIIIDDFSEDDTYKICETFAHQNMQFKVLKLKDLLNKNEPQIAYKKTAIEAAVNIATGKLIITTDADCRLQQHWIHSIVSFYEKEKCVLIAAPVGFYNDHTNFQHFQALDFCGMQAITGAMINMQIYNMANSANLAYEKQAFLEVDGYKDINQKASGDDMLLVYKIAQKHPDKIKFLKNKAAIVLTEPMKTVSDFLQQRFRWTSKSASYQDKKVPLILLAIYLFVVSIWCNAIYFIGNIIYTSIFPDPTINGLLNFFTSLIFLFIVIIQVVTKTIVDYFFLKNAASFFNREDLMKSFFISELLHIWYIPFVGTLGNIVKYKWKGRTLK